MKIKHKKIILAFVIIFILAIIFLIMKICPSVIINDIQKSHIEANLPKEKKLHEIIKRDLSKFFIAKGYSQFEILFEFAIVPQN